MKPERKSREKLDVGKKRETKEDCFDLSSLKVAITGVGKTKTVVRNSVVEKLIKRSTLPRDEIIGLIMESRSNYEEYQNFIIGLKAKGISVPTYY